MRAFNPSAAPIIRIIIASVLIAVFGSCSGREAPPLNLLIIVSDALRADVLGCYGGSARTPNIDRLASEGVLFERCYSTTPWTWPSSVSMFTGNYPGAYIQRAKQFFPARQPQPDPLIVAEVPEEEDLLSEKLRSAGYEVRMALQNQFPRQSNSLQGFVGLETAETPELKIQLESVLGLAGRHSPELLSILHYLSNVPSDHPFYLLAWILDPHCEYKAPQRFRRRIDTGGKPLPREESFYTDLTDRQLRALTSDLNDREKKHIKRLYQAEVEFVDKRVGAILKTLKYRGLDGQTVVVLTSDHGEAFWEHGLPSHGNSYYEEMVHIPLIIRGPGLPAGRRVNTPVSQIGLTPTVAEILKIDLSESVQGTSYTGILRDITREPTSIYLMSARPHLHADAILDSGFKMITGIDGSKELYDLDADPDETLDISADHPNIVARLEALRIEIMEDNRRLREQWETAGQEDVNTVDDGEILKQLNSLGYVE